MFQLKITCAIYRICFQKELLGADMGEELGTMRFRHNEVHFDITWPKDLKIDLIMFEPHHVKFYFTNLLTFEWFDTLQIIDNFADFFWTFFDIMTHDLYCL